MFILINYKIISNNVYFLCFISYTQSLKTFSLNIATDFLFKNFNILFRNFNIEFFKVYIISK